MEPSSSVDLDLASVRGAAGRGTLASRALGMRRGGWLSGLGLPLSRGIERADSSIRRLGAIVVELAEMGSFRLANTEASGMAIEMTFCESGTGPDTSVDDFWTGRGSSGVGA